MEEEEEEEKGLAMKEWTLRVRCVDGALRIDAFHRKTGAAEEEESKPWRQLLVLPPPSSRDKRTTQQTFLPASNINRHPGRFLPPEVLLHVFSFLSAFELSLVAALVDTEWYALSQDDHLWRGLVLGLSELDDSLLEDPYVAQLSDWKAVYRYLTKKDKCSRCHEAIAWWKKRAAQPACRYHAAFPEVVHSSQSYLDVSQRFRCCKQPLGSPGCQTDMKRAHRRCLQPETTAAASTTTAKTMKEKAKGKEHDREKDDKKDKKGGVKDRRKPKTRNKNKEDRV
ncbi:hypothetical protein QOT17_018769 [Balamuthia mandrillaris]